MDMQFKSQEPMKEKEEEKTLTISEKELERIIQAAVVAAIRESKEEAKLPANVEDELKEAPAIFSLFTWIITIFLAIFSSLSAAVVFVCGQKIVQQGFDWGLVLIGLVFAFVFVLSCLSIREINKTKKIEVLNTVFSAIMAISGLIVSIVGAVFAFMALK